MAANPKREIYTATRARDVAEIIGVHELRRNAEGLTRRVVRGEVIRNRNRPEESLKISLVHQRRSTQNAAWTDIDAIPLSRLKSGEAYKLDLNTEETKRLSDILSEWWAVAEAPIEPGLRRHKVVPREQVVVPRETANAVKSLLAEVGIESLADAVESAVPGIAALIEQRRRQRIREDALSTFETKLREGSWQESDWQQFFEANEWILGFGAAHQYLHRLLDHPTVGQTSVDGSGGSRGDMMMSTAADRVRFTALVEIKTPGAALLSKQKYRNGVFGASTELSSAIAQVQMQCASWEISSQYANNLRMLEPDRIFTFRPRGVLIIGHTRELEESHGNRRSFELLRRNLNAPDILTYDELFHRAKMMLDS